MVFSLEYHLPMKIIPDASGNFISEKFRELCMNLNIEQAVSSSYHHQGNGYVEACIRSIKHTVMKCSDTNADTYIALLHIRIQTTWARIIKSCSTIIQLTYRGIIQVMKKSSISANNDDDHYKALAEREKSIKNYDILKGYNSISTGSPEVVQ